MSLSKNPQFHYKDTIKVNLRVVSISKGEGYKTTQEVWMSDPCVEVRISKSSCLTVSLIKIKWILMVLCSTRSYLKKKITYWFWLSSLELCLEQEVCYSSRRFIICWCLLQGQIDVFVAVFSSGENTNKCWNIGTNSKRLVANSFRLQS